MARLAGNLNPLTLRGHHLNELTPAQHKRLQLLQLGIGQRFDEPLALGMLMQYPGECGQHSRIDRTLASLPDCCRNQAIRSASITSSRRMCGFTDQPTICRLNKSITTAMYS